MIPVNLVSKLIIIFKLIAVTLLVAALIATLMENDDTEILALCGIGFALLSRF